jgi:hypothetical protein
MLIPAYGALWAAGRWYAGQHRQAWSSLVALVASAAVGATLAEVFSTGGYYLLSGTFAAPTLEGLVAGVLKYLPATLTHLALYLGLAAVAYLAFALTQARGEGAVAR